MPSPRSSSSTCNIIIPADELIPAQADDAREARLDRLFDLYVHVPMQKIVGTDCARRRAMIRMEWSTRAKRCARRSTCWKTTWPTAPGPTDKNFSLADCAAAPALFYANKVMPIADHHPHLARYLDRLMQRPSYARVLAEAQPYFHLFPG